MAVEDIGASSAMAGRSGVFMENPTAPFAVPVRDRDSVTNHSIKPLQPDCPTHSFIKWQATQSEPEPALQVLVLNVVPPTESSDERIDRSTAIEQITAGLKIKAEAIRSRIMKRCNSMVTSVQNRSKAPSFMAASRGKAPRIEIEWAGSPYTAKLTDDNKALGNYTFSSDYTGMTFTTSGNVLNIISPLLTT